ncbi:MAG TPA: diadenylate cyclase CdaA [Bdellovibrionales bacterium]|nr:diadenylate cyclase CdaA [Bdellovibrionales bacterium]
MVTNVWNGWMGVFTQLRVQDLFDLFLVWLVVYRVLLLIKKSGAVQILSGLGILAIAYMLSIWFELITFNYILEKFFSNLFVIVVILFQGEIRRALAQIGSNPFLSGQSRVEETHMIEELAKGMIACAQRGFGALIVLEREISLDYFIEEGRPVHAEVSSELIQSLFHPAGPLHDGAVLIRNGRIESAGCFLPLSKNSALDKNLGTRHRAAIGLTEETDAYVFVVSEENRAVGMAHSGILQMDVDHHTIRQALYDLYGLSKQFERVHT